MTGVCARGIVTPIFQRGDDLVAMVCDSVLKASQAEGFALHDRDVVAVTEAVLGRTQGNYATYGQIASDIRAKFGSDGDRVGSLGAVFPIQSRNRFAVLPAIAMAADRLYVLLSYPSDEFGNTLFDPARLEETGVNPYTDGFDEAGFRKSFGHDTVHPFTGVDYIESYKNFGDNIEIVFSNDPRYILEYTGNVLCCDVHSRARTKAALRKTGAERVLGLDDILTQPVEGSGYNAEYGLLGHNKAAEDRVKLFPRDSGEFVLKLQSALYDATGKRFEVMVYGDGAFKDPRHGIWELADPVVSLAHTGGLDGVPNEIKIKYVADDKLAGVSGQALIDAIKTEIRGKDANLVGQKASLGTTPRYVCDLLGSLADLVSGSGDRGTPVVLIQNYFSNYASE